MTLTLADQLKKRINEKKLTIREVERRGDLRMNAVRNIILGNIKQPGAHTLKTIANVLECTIDELLETEETEFLTTLLDKKNIKPVPLKNYELYLEASNYVIQKVSSSHF